MKNRATSIQFGEKKHQQKKGRPHLLQNSVSDLAVSQASPLLSFRLQKFSVVSALGSLTEL